MQRKRNQISHVFGWATPLGDELRCVAETRGGIDRSFRAHGQSVPVSQPPDRATAHDHDVLEQPKA
jgi:hypothetical protein